MKTKKTPNENVKKTLQVYIKNGNDTSDIFREYSMKGLNLTGAIIKSGNYINEDLSGTNFYRAVIGEEGKTISFAGSKLTNCNFNLAQFPGTTIIRNCDLKGSSLESAYFRDVQYQYADLRNTILCETTFKFGSKCGYGAIIEFKVFEDLMKYFGLNVTKK